MRLKVKLAVLTMVLALSAGFARQPLITDAQDENPFAPTQLFEIASVIGAAVQGQGTPAQTPLAIVANDVAPFWTAGQIGSQRAASELGVPVIFNAPIRPGDTVAQGSIVENFID